MLKRSVRVAWIGGAAALLAAILIGVLLPAAFGRDVIMISPHAPAVVELNKQSWTSGDDVVDIYGIRNGQNTRVLFTNADRIVIPEQDPGLTLYRVNKQAGENPLQAQTAAFLAKWLALGGAGIIVAGLILARLSRRPEDA